jgi:hypothetical protein
VGGIASIIPVIGVTVAFGTVFNVPAIVTVPVLAAGPAAAPLKITLKVQVPAGATTGAVKQGLAGSIRKSGTFGVIVAIVRVLTEFRLATVTVTGGTESIAGRCAGKTIVVGVTDIPSTFPSRVNRFVVPLSAGVGPATVKELGLGATAPVTVTSAMESPT